MTTLHLTDRALADLDRIDRHSVATWGAQVAAQYLSDLSQALARLEQNPGLLRSRPEYSGRLQFYTAREHVLVCDQIGDRLFVLTIWHGAMDFVERLDVLEPQLAREVELLGHKLPREE